MNLLRHKKRRKRKLWYSKWTKRQHRAATRDASTSETEDNQSKRRNWQEDPEVVRKNRTWWGWGILHFSPTVCETHFCWLRTWFQNDRPKSHQGYTNSLSICQFSIFDANTFSKQFTRHRQIFSLSLQWVLASNSGNILTLHQATGTPSPMQTFLDLDGQVEYHTFQQ